MGQLKQFLPLGNKPVIRHCLDHLMAAGIRDIVVVLSQMGSQIHDSIKNLPVQIVFNDSHESEMVESVRTGLRALSESCSGVMVHLSDHPLVSVETLKRLVQYYLETPDKIIIPVYKEKRGHPSLFPKPVIYEVFKGLNLRDIINRDSGRIRMRDVNDEGITLDMDMKEDYEKILRKIRSSH